VVVQALGLLESDPAVLLAQGIVALLRDLSLLAGECEAFALHHLHLDLPQLGDDLLRAPVLASGHLRFLRVGSTLSVNPAQIEPVRSAGNVRLACTSIDWWTDSEGAVFACLVAYLVQCSFGCLRSFDI
jgi:hypothetical protein